MSLLGVIYNNWFSVPAQERALRETKERELAKMGITDHDPNVVEYEIEQGSDGERCYIAFSKTGNLVYVSTKTGFDEVEECLTLEQAIHLHRWLEKNVLVGQGIGMIR